MYIKKEPGSMEATFQPPPVASSAGLDGRQSPRSVCFVCGNVGHPEQYWLKVKPSSSPSGGPNEAYFPFLESHEPPTGYVLDTDSAPTAVRACYLCYSLLMQQWDCYERDATPHPRYECTLTFRQTSELFGTNLLSKNLLYGVMQ
jgi:hypothetical protein